MIGPVGALAVVEGSRLARNPVVWVSFLPTVFWVRNAVRTDSAEDELFLLIGYGLGLTGFVMVTIVILAVFLPVLAGQSGNRCEQLCQFIYKFE